MNKTLKTTNHNQKQQLGQFYTTNAKYITKDLIDLVPNNSAVIDPFAGKFDLLNLFDKNYYNIEAFDIDPQNNATQKQDTILNPPNYINKWIITNPPYLARNKNKNKSIYDKFNVSDLYEAFLKTIKNCNGGILILPLNFLSSQRNKIRTEFFNNFSILKLYIFEEQVFNDTSNIICSFFFKKRNSFNDLEEIETIFIPNNINKEIILKKQNGYRFGNEYFDILKNGDLFNIKISRLLQNQICGNSKIFLKAIDTGTETGKISLSLSEEPFYGKISDRAFATICFSKEFSIEQQTIICNEFNEILNSLRFQYNSLFLTNFRNSTKFYARKRISFREAYKIIGYIIKKNNFGT